MCGNPLGRRGARGLIQENAGDSVKKIDITNAVLSPAEEAVAGPADTSVPPQDSSAPVRFYSELASHSYRLDLEKQDHKQVCWHRRVRRRIVLGWEPAEPGVLICRGRTCVRRRVISLWAWRRVDRLLLDDTSEWVLTVSCGITD